MSALVRKINTLGRVVRRHGVTGMVSVLRDKAAPLVRPPVQYARLAPSAVTLLARHGRPGLLVTAVGAGIGDDLLCTAIYRELRLRGRRDFWVASKYRELYAHNDDVAVVVPPLPRYDRLLERLGTEVVHPWYTGYNPAFDRDDPMPEQHLISIMCQKAGITGTVTLRPYFTLTDGERQRGKLARRQVAIQSSGLNAHHSMTTKNWPLAGYQALVSSLKDTYDFVQVGSANDPPLEGALDLRGKTSLRGTAAVLAESLAFVGQVGFLMHLARAVDCRSVIVYGGRETPAQSGYPCNENLYSPVGCSPCWLLNTCPYERACLTSITVADVAGALEAQVARHGEPLACDTVTITAELAERNAARHKAAAEAHRWGWSVLYQPGATTPALRVREAFDGRARAYDGDRLLGDFEFKLKAVEETPEASFFTGIAPDADGGRRTVFGTLTSAQPRTLDGYIGTRLTLEIHDGRLLDFTVAKVTGGAGYLIQALGDFRSDRHAPVPLPPPPLQPVEPRP